MPSKISIIGKRFGKLKVIGEATRRQGRHYSLCLCDCGKRKSIITKDIKAGKSRSCGCGVVSATIARNFKHGHSTRQFHTPTYRAWKGIIQRCLNPHNPQYDDYGGRGITVCERWKDYSNFLSDMGAKPDGLSIGRIDNERSYYPRNCRWETRFQQARNTRTNRILTVNGISVCIAEIAPLFGHPPQRVSDRLHRGWSSERALHTPVNPKRSPAA